MAQKNEKTKASKYVNAPNSISMSDSVDVILVRSPLRFLSDAIAQKRLLEGVVVSVMYFERFGTSKLEEYFKSKGIPIEPQSRQQLKARAKMHPRKPRNKCPQCGHELRKDLPLSGWPNHPYGLHTLPQLSKSHQTIR